MANRTYIFNPDSIKSEWVNLFDGIKARKIDTGSIELKFEKPDFINDSILQEWMDNSDIKKW